MYKSHPLEDFIRSRESGAADPGAKHGADDQPALCVTVHRGKCNKFVIFHVQIQMRRFK